MQDNSQRISAVTAILRLPMDGLIADANAAGFSTEEVVSAIEALLAEIRSDYERDPDPADDPVAP